MSLKELAAAAGSHQWTIEDWLARARKEGEGALQEKVEGVGWAAGAN